MHGMVELFFAGAAKDKNTHFTGGLYIKIIQVLQPANEHCSQQTLNGPNLFIYFNFKGHDI